MMSAEDELLSLDRTDKGNLVDSVVNAARTCNKLFTKNTCRLCQVYVDKQVEFEQRQECNGTSSTTADGRNGMSQFASGYWTAATTSVVAGTDDDSPVERVWVRTSEHQPTLEVELYRQFLFDEESVVDGVSERETQEAVEEAMIRGRTEKNSVSSSTSSSIPSSAVQEDRVIVSQLTD